MVPADSYSYLRTAVNAPVRVALLRVTQRSLLPSVRHHLLCGANCVLLHLLIEGLRTRPVVRKIDQSSDRLRLYTTSPHPLAATSGLVFRQCTHVAGSPGPAHERDSPLETNTTNKCQERGTPLRNVVKLFKTFFH